MADPNQFDSHIVDAFEREQLVLHVLRKHRAHAATGRGQCHFDIHADSCPRASGAQVAIVNQAEIDDVHRDFRVVTGAQLVPDFLFEMFLGDRAPVAVPAWLRATSMPSASASLPSMRNMLPFTTTV